ncbi:MAG: hypothetical protein B7X35_00490 [Halothiobacillus sp. 14-56-357]|jgi:transposase|nr:MAG: hypothetical protein B7X35_00490 [Halothiobacillus sp. 14-56-357]OZB78350.1 MAG: hypothetical protein B7X29_05240 [Halothiobacillus sp. 13-55-115]
MAKEHITMSYQEINRLGVIQQVVGKRLRQGDVALQLGVSVRQVKRLVARYRAEGAADQGWGTACGEQGSPSARPSMAQ